MVNLFLKKFASTNNSLPPFASKLSRIPADHYESNSRFAAVVLSGLPVFCLLGARGVYAMAQDRQKGDRIPPGTQSQKDESTFRVNVRLVNVFTTVTDSRGAPVADLTKDDFQLLEDGVPQTIKVFEKESAIPLSIALAIDTSPSTMRDFKLETTSARRFVHSILRSEDRLSIFEVTEHVDQITRFTSDIRTIEHGIDSLRTGRGLPSMTLFFSAQSRSWTGKAARYWS